MDSQKIRDERQLAGLLEEIRSYSSSAQTSRLEKIRQSLELDEMYYEQKGNEAGLARIGRCLALVDTRLSELRQTGD